MSHLTISKKRVSGLSFICLLMVALNTSCNRQASDPRLPILQEQTRMLMILEAQQGFNELFKTSFNPDKTQLLVGEDLKKYLEQKKKSLSLVPEDIRTSIENNQGAGLVILGGKPDKKGGMHDVIYLRPPRFGRPRFFATLDPDPCGDGNPATCEFCSGCSGESSPGGTIGTCVCTEGCGGCRPCPPC